MKKRITESIRVNVPKEIKRLARERVGQPKAEKIIAEKKRRKNRKRWGPEEAVEDSGYASNIS